MTTISIWPGCEPSIAAAVEKFSTQWGPYSTKSRKYSIYRLVRELIDPTWTQYLGSLLGTDLAGVIDFMGCPQSGLMLSQFAHANGFQALESELIKLHRIVNPILAERSRAVFTATLDTLRDLALGCSLKRPKKTRTLTTEREHRLESHDPESTRFCAVCNRLTQFAQYTLGESSSDMPLDLALLNRQYCVSHLSGDGQSSLRVQVNRRPALAPISSNLNLRHSHGRRFCELCGRYTELEAHLQGGPWPNGTPADAQLSARYCEVHSARAQKDRGWNLAYRRGNRKRKRFNEELARLERQSYERSEPVAGTGNRAVDMYMMNILRQLNAYPDEESELRRIASSLVENKITDRKKEIVMLRRSGMKQQEIATRLKIHQQAVSKALRSIPEAYRFE